MAVAANVPPPPVMCSISEHRVGANQIQIEARIRSDVVQAGTYRLQVTKRGPAGSTQVNQQSEFSLNAGGALEIRGLTFSVEPEASYQAVLSIKAGDAAYTCERTGPEGSDRL